MQVHRRRGQRRHRSKPGPRQVSTTGRRGRLASNTQPPRLPIPIHPRGYRYIDKPVPTVTCTPCAVSNTQSLLVQVFVCNGRYSHSLSIDRSPAAAPASLSFGEAGRSQRTSSPPPPNTPPPRPAPPPTPKKNGKNTRRPALALERPATSNGSIT